MWVSIVFVYLFLLHNSEEANPFNMPQFKIDLEVSKLMKQGENPNVVVSFVQGIKPALDKTASLRSGGVDWAIRNQAVVDALRSNADITQQGVLNILSAQPPNSGNLKSYKKYWSSNVMFIEQASPYLIHAIAKVPEVKLIRMERDGRVPEIQDSASLNKKDWPIPQNEEQKRNWGLNHIEVDKAWEELGGNKGEGVLVGTIDTGVRHTHEAIRDNFVGSKYGWFDPLGKSSEPFSLNLHGTHTLGVLAGSKGIGVAPGVKWMTCLSCNVTTCPGRTLLDCMEFMSCPTLPDGSNPDCSKAPRVINNSWMTAHGVTDFNDQILAWRAQGILPVFAIGNNGMNCKRTTAPGELPWVIGVGAGDWNDGHYIRSSVGPAADGGIKPDIIAPGFEVLSASDVSDNSYKALGGTSMACPHVAGVIALLLVRDPNMTYEEVYDIIISTAETNVHLNKSAEQRYCKEGKKDKIPNIYFGYGRLQAFKAIQEQTKRLILKPKNSLRVVKPLLKKPSSDPITFKKLSGEKSLFNREKLGMF